MPAGPFLEVDPPTVVFEDLYAGETGEQMATIRNAGTETLVIEKVQPDCGCTGVVLGDKELDPGEATQLKVTFKTSDSYVGRTIRKRITIHSNDPRQSGQYRLELAATVKAGVIVEPGSVNLGEVVPGQTQRVTIRLESESGAPFKILQASVSDPDVQIDYPKDVDGTNHTVKVEFVPQQSRRGARTELTIATDHPKRSSIQVPIYWRIEPPVTVRPSYLPLGKLDPGAEVTRSISLKSRLGTPLTDISFRVEGAPITVRAAQDFSNPEAWDLTFHIPQQLAGEKVSARLVIDTKQEQASEVPVAITAQVSDEINLMPELP